MRFKMTTSQHRCAARIAALVAAALSAMAPGLCTAQQSSSSPGGSSYGPGPNQSAVQKYWTPERMRAAKPVELHPKTEVSNGPTPSAGPGGSLPPTGGSGSPPAPVPNAKNPAIP
jgi:hypothetical protein